MPCITDPPSVSSEQWLEHMLCNACRYLTIEQINSISGLDCYIHLKQWYVSHLMEDARYYSHDYIKDIVKNNEHLQGEIIDSILSSKEERIERSKKELERIRNELKRFNLQLILNENSTMIKTL